MFCCSLVAMAHQNQTGENPVDKTTTYFKGVKTTTDDIVSIVFNGSTVSVDNPLSSSVTITTNGADVIINSTGSNVQFNVSGSSTNGSLLFYSGSDFGLVLDNLSLTSTSQAAINVQSPVTVTLQSVGTSTVVDGASGTQNGAFYLAGSLTTANGFGTLALTGNTKHALSAAGTVTLTNGTLRVNNANGDGIHAATVNVSGTSNVNVVGSASDGIDASGNVSISGGSLNITSTGEDVKGIKATGNIIISGGTIGVNVSGYNSKAISATNSMTVSGGSFNITTTGEEDKCFTSNGDITFSGGVAVMNISGANANGISSDVSVQIQDDADITIVSSSQDGKCIKSDGTLTIDGGTISINHSGAISKGLKSVGLLSMNGGIVDITSSGATVIETVNSQNVPSYCTAIKGDADISISGGSLTINLPTTNNGGKGISADGNITINGGIFDIETHGAGAAYTVSGSTKDSYTSSCIKCNGNLSILAGDLTCSSTGAGGKGITCDGNMVLGTNGGSDTGLILGVTTSGARITVSQGSSWGGGPGGEDGSEYANPKGIKSAGTMTINSGTISVYCSQSSSEGGECIESKSNMTINGGVIDAYSVYDDAINASKLDNGSTSLTINGGMVYAHTDHNDAIDSNGTLEINGGVVIANGSSQPECGFDCDQNQFKVTGGYMFGTGGDTSNPTTNVCTQPSLKITTKSDCAIQVLNASGTVIATYRCPTLSGGGGWGPGGGNSGSVVLLLTSPGIVYGQNCTVKYGGTISGGTNWNGYYTGNVTYSGGQTTTVNVNSMLKTVTASSSTTTTPCVTTTIVRNISQNSASCGGNVSSTGGATVTARGICWSTSHNPVATGNHATNGSGTGTYTCNMTGLSANTTYYVRAYATNSQGTAYGTELSFTTLPGNVSTPTVTTAAVSNITQTTATGGGNVTDDGGATVTARGICWSTSHNPTVSGSHTTNGTGTGTFTANMTGLTANTTYYVRAYATNSEGTAYGNEVSFTTLQAVSTPTVTTTAVSNIAQTTATGGGNVTADGGATVTVRGICWSTSHNPIVSGNHTTNGTGNGAFTANMTGLTANTTYYVRAYATNSQGTAYGSEVSFTTLEEEVTGLIGDADVNGQVNINDVLAIMRHSLQISTLSAQGLQLADVNGDGQVNMNDAVLLLRIVLGIS